MVKTVIELSQVRVQYSGRTVLSIPELKLPAGRRYGLIGENGSGKSTLLKVLAQLLIPDSGTIKGISLEDMGYLPQSPYIFSFNVLKNVTMALDGQNNADKKALCALESVGMQKHLRQRGDRLSGGEAQRVALARLLAKDHKVLMLDEPSSATDIRGMDSIERVLLDYWQRTKCTLIFSTHSPAQALRLAEVVLYLENGEVVECGDAKKVLTAPDQQKTQAFLNHWLISDK